MVTPHRQHRIMGSVRVGANPAPVEASSFRGFATTYHLRTPPPFARWGPARWIWRAYVHLGARPAQLLRKEYLLAMGSLATHASSATSAAAVEEVDLFFFPP